MIFFRGNLIHSITVQQPGVARDMHGDPVAIGVQVTDVAARVQAERNVVVDKDGNEVVTAHKILTATEIKPRALIWIPHLGDDITEIGDARTPIAIKESPRLKLASARLWTIFL